MGTISTCPDGTQAMYRIVPSCTACTILYRTCTACTIKQYTCTSVVPLVPALVLHILPVPDVLQVEPNLYRMYCSSTTVPDVPQAVHFVQNLTLHETYRTGAVTDYTARKSTSGRSVTTKKYENDQLELRKSNICIK